MKVHASFLWKTRPYFWTVLTIFALIMVGLFTGCILVGVYLTNGYGKIIVLHVIVRHGDRTPGTYPNDIYGEADYYPLGQGRLTEKGIERCYQVGRKLRSRYVDFLGSKYYYKEIEALSSSVPRCRVTMQAVLSTLYPKYSNELACSEGQLIDFDYVDPKGDSLISTYITCPKALEVNYTTVPGHVCEEYETVRKVVSEHSGWEIYRPLELFLVYDTLKAQEEVGLKLPDWVKPIWPEPFHTCGRNFYQSIADDVNSRSHIAGNLLRKIVENTQEKLTDEKLKDRKLYLYTGHDMNLVTLLGSLGLYNNEEVSYSAYLAFEVHQINDVVGFKVYHENFEGSEPTLLDIPGCGTFCPLEDFVELVSKSFPGEWCNF